VAQKEYQPAAKRLKGGTPELRCKLLNDSVVMDQSIHMNVNGNNQSVFPSVSNEFDEPEEDSLLKILKGSSDSSPDEQTGMQSPS